MNCCQKTSVGFHKRAEAIAALTTIINEPDAGAQLIRMEVAGRVDDDLEDTPSYVKLKNPNTIVGAVSALGFIQISYPSLTVVTKSLRKF